MFQIKAKRVFLSTALLGVSLVLASTALAQRSGGREGARGQGEQGRGGGRGDWAGGEFDPTSFIQRLDANGNGILEQSEMSDRTRGFLERMGLDPTRDHSLASISERFQQQRREASGQPATESQPAAATRDVKRLVPGFGVETTAAALPSRFGSDVTIVGGAPSSLSNYSSSIQEMVQQALARYDTNGNGVIDGEEFNRVRWSSPSAREADLNGDGVLTVNEIAERFLARERAAAQADQNRNASTEGRGEESRRGDSRRDERTPGRDSGGGSNSPAARGPSEGNSADSARGSTGGSNNVQEYRRYAEDMLKRYDTDGDGKLSREEVSRMNRKPVDLDNDGFVTVEEMIEWISGNSPSSTNAASSSANNRSEEGNPSDRSGRGGFSSGRPSRGGSSTVESSRGSAATQFSFFERDANGDGQVQMHEFAQEWTDEILRQFRSYDLNGDGVITYEEFEAARKAR